ncbi:MAG: ShlB/FhaC/HecB family hemolysin secretion/activation protein [Alphaproteobacteria bacterium]|nr:ShlB/FhaC/HecB family hemolysin secretion/activation protein [Alphaproteobacteria bacterium]MBU2270766.1 ShlB/FhaC/HecB family hemolysin secretion/activation protein [Alphaproteobacteria bacterium]MBU2418443.1 ShlB/FhaC/HecB family hemolysin secretion/activation protein [Alphaproteobacteria bacterium]
MLRSSLIVAALLAAAHTAHAQVPPVGGQLQQIPPPAPPRTPAPDIRIERPDAPVDAVAEGRRIRVDAVRITGATLFSEAELVAAAQVTPGLELTLPELRNAAARITRFYNSHGYVLAQAYLPAQDVVAGTVTIAVIEGRYGDIALRNEAGVPDALASGLLHGLNPGDPVAIAPLERRLLLLSDVPGVVVRSTLSPGAEVGSSDLTVDLTPAPSIYGSLEADNAGNRYTGAYRFGGSVNFANPTGMGDLISLRLLASTEGLAYGRAAWQVPFGAAAVGVAWTHMQYDLGEEFSALDAGGEADIFSVFASYPLIRSRAANLYADASFDAKYLSDEIGLVSQVSDKEIHAVTVGLRGDSRDDFGGGGWNAGSLSWTTGNLDIENPLERAADALAARSRGGFGKLQYSLSRLQTVSGPLSLYGSVRGQLATDNLDSSEKMELGGAYAVRAYPEGEAYGDEGHVATLEARLALDQWTPSLPGRFQLIGFVDRGEVDFAHDPWFSGSNHARRSGYGVGLNWSGPDDLFIRASYARRIGDQAVTSGPDERGRAWFQIVRLF